MKYKLIVRKDHWTWQGTVKPPPMTYVWEYPDRGSLERAWRMVHRPDRAYSKILSVKMMVGNKIINQNN